MVESVNSESSSSTSSGAPTSSSPQDEASKHKERSTSPSQVVARRSNSFKEVHPKFRKQHTTPDYLSQAEEIRMHKLNRQTSSCSGSSPPTSSQNSTNNGEATTGVPHPPQASSPPASHPLTSSLHPLSSTLQSLSAAASLHGLDFSSAASRHQLAAASLAALISHRQQEEAASVEAMEAEDNEAPLDFSMKRRSKSPPPPYNKYHNPLRQNSPPRLQHRQPAVSPPTMLSAIKSAAASIPPPYPFSAVHLSTTTSSPAPLPPAYPQKPIPVARPPPPTYEAAIASKPTSPPGAQHQRIPTTSSTFLNLNPRPTPFRTTPPPSTVVKPEPERPLPGGLLIRQKPDLENKENEREIRKITIVEENACGSLEEHFRKSLGADYSKLFKPGEEEKQESDEEPMVDVVETSPEIKKEQHDHVKAFREDTDMTGYTVEDHFAKALGDTWTKLQQQDDQDKKQIKQELTAT